MKTRASGTVDFVGQSRARTCGQACLAMLTGLSERAIIEAFDPPYEGGTHWRNLRDVARFLGFKADDRLTRVFDKSCVPETCIFRVWWSHGPGAETHWCVRDGVRVLDPYFGECPQGWLSVPTRGCGRVTSYGRIWRP